MRSIAVSFIAGVLAGAGATLAGAMAVRPAPEARTATASPPPDSIRSKWEEIRPGTRIALGSSPSVTWALEQAWNIAEIPDRPDWLIPRAHVWIVTRTFLQAKYLWKTLKEAAPAHLVDRLHENERAMILTNGGVVEIKYTECPPRLIAVGLDAAVVVGTISDADMKTVRDRLGSPGRERHFATAEDNWSPCMIAQATQEAV